MKFDPKTSFIEHIQSRQKKIKGKKFEKNSSEKKYASDSAEVVVNNIVLYLDNSLSYEMMIENISIMVPVSLILQSPFFFLEFQFSLFHFFFLFQDYLLSNVLFIVNLLRPTKYQIVLFYQI